MTESAKTYDPSQVEPQVSELWQRGNHFHAEPDGRDLQQRFSIVIPPPNVTGALHLGHALNNTLQDILIRWHRMQGHNTLWMPGTDHAGIATQAVVEKRLFEEEGKTRHDVGRDELVKRIWQWKDQYEARIISQLKLMGCSCDFQRKRFTLDEGCSRAVRETFFKLFRDGYIFRGKRLVNWDCDLQTAVADDEVYHENIKGKFYHFRYPIRDAQREGSTPPYVVIATTRPETMLGDTAVAVNPSDPRYQHLVGRSIVLPLMDREIPIIADQWADPQLGSGCVKITPAHDPNDYDVWQRHPEIGCLNILNPDGSINENGGKYNGMDRFEARQAVLKDLQALDLIEKIEDHVHDVGHSDRSKTPIEPYLSDQWFVKMDTALSERTLDAVRNGEVRFRPERYKNAYLDWLGEKRDWCISRQLWWGHRIPVWSKAYDLTEENWTTQWLGDGMDALLDEKCLNPENAHAIVVRVSSGQIIDHRREINPIVPDTAGEYRVYVCLREDQQDDVEFLTNTGFQQDLDVLDTWFSSALWPQSTLGWPADDPRGLIPAAGGQPSLLEYYYPTNVLSTARDIVTLWVVRMVLTGLYNIGQKPFHEVYIHPKILDGRGVTMSKSKGNGVDPADIIEAFGADALRFGLAAITTETQDIRMPVEYLCPHCQQLTPQTPKNMFGADGNPSTEMDCSDCGQRFATRWADTSAQKEKGLGLMISDKFESARNFMNKLWNAAHFAFMNLEGLQHQALAVGDLPPEDRWILAELSQAIRRVHSALSNYQYSRATLAARNFFWDALCDWYLELAKFRINQNHRAAAARQVLALCLDQVLRLLHPIIPFATEHLWQRLNEIAPQRGLPGVVDLPRCDVLTVAQYPPADGYALLDNAAICATFHDLQDATRAVREVRNTAGISPKDRVRVTIKTSADRADHLQLESHILREMAGIDELSIDPDAQRLSGSAIKIVGGLQIFVHDVIDDAQERQRVEKAITGLEKRIKGMNGKLANEGYIRSAPPEVIEETKQMLADAEQERQTFNSILDLLS